MSALQDPEMERLANLLAQGTLTNAREIATLLRVELGEQASLSPDDGVLQSYLRLFRRMTVRATN